MNIVNIDKPVIDAQQKFYDYLWDNYRITKAIIPLFLMTVSAAVYVHEITVSKYMFLWFPLSTLIIPYSVTYRIHCAQKQERYLAINVVALKFRGSVIFMFLRIFLWFLLVSCLVSSYYRNDFINDIPVIGALFTMYNFVITVRKPTDLFSTKMVFGGV